MLNALGLLNKRRFLPLFTTQFLGALNDNLFKQGMVLFATYSIFNDARVEQGFNALATGLSTLPFILFSALAGQLADSHDKAKIIRIVKTLEILIMMVGSGGLMLAAQGHTRIGIVLMLATVFLLGVHSTFFGPIKYAILPQHLGKDDVLGATGLVEAGTYIAILLGTIIAGFLTDHVWMTAVGTLLVAIVGWFSGRQIAPAPREGAALAINYNIVTSSWRLINGTMHIPRLFLAICSISFFWTIGAVLIIIFPPLAKNLLTTTPEVASLFTATLSIGIAIGSVVINSMLKGRVSAKFGPASVIAMAAFVVTFSLMVRLWIPAPPGHFYDWKEFIAQPRAIPVMLSLLGIAITGGMFVVPLYAFLTTTVSADQTARTVAANNVVNSLAMVVGAVVVIGITGLGVTPENMLFVVAGMCLVAAWLAQKLHLACD
jgi:MFS family permease